MVSIDDLPNEIILHICKYISGDSLPDCRLVCRKFNQIVESYRKSLQKQKSFRLSVERTDFGTNWELVPSPFIVAEKQIEDQVENSVAFLKSEESSEEDEQQYIFYKKSRWEVHRKTVEVRNPVASLEKHLSKRLMQHDYEELQINHAPAELLSMITRLLVDNRSEVRYIWLDLFLSESDVLEEFLRTDPAKKADMLQIEWNMNFYTIPDDIFKQLTFSRFGSVGAIDCGVVFSLAQIVWIITEWKEKRRNLRYFNVQTPLADNDIFQEALTDLGFVNEDHRDSSVILLNRGGSLMTMRWYIRGQHIYMRVVIEKK